MPFHCPECTASGSLRITSKLELPPDGRSDEITLQLVECSHCGFAGIAIYEESRRGALDSDSFSHTGYRVKGKDFKALMKAVRKCPSPGNARCKCAVHRRFGTRDQGYRWNGLKDIELGRSFRMDL